MLCFQVLWWARKIPGGAGSLKGRRVVGLALALTCERERLDQTRPNLLLGEVVLALVVEEEEEENKRVEWRGRRRHTRILSGFCGWVAVV